jgi:hypothetical protein
MTRRSRCKTCTQLTEPDLLVEKECLGCRVHRAIEPERRAFMESVRKHLRNGANSHHAETLRRRQIRIFHKVGTVVSNDRLAFELGSKEIERAVAEARLQLAS